MGKYHRIVLIDDDEITNFINENLIYEIGLADRVEAFIAAEKALKKIEHTSSEVSSTLILLDLKMPVFDGFDFLEQFNTMKRMLTSQIRIIILTSSENPRDTERLRALGYHQYITKPLTKEKLQDL
ncbi:response regulator [Catalinimonas niigatensis]|uniref:response regulator n=1 Tax=Catalinimonas niigatensis TaxID=1397264 RepID=UPI0026661C84|nr:response regulator [Catalinimonas niigatensis]WPP50698.1 response regulator [Catalinimonas niigatensis]